MKLRHILPWIPVIGFFWTASFLFRTWEDKDIKSADDATNYIWGGEVAYHASALAQGIGIIALIILIS